MVFVAFILYVWYFSTRNKLTQLATRRERIDKRGQTFQCDIEYLKDISNYEGCIPNECGRYVSDKIITATEADILYDLAKKGDCTYILVISTFLKSFNSGNHHVHKYFTKFFFSWDFIMNRVSYNHTLVIPMILLS